MKLKQARKINTSLKQVHKKLTISIEGLDPAVPMRANSAYAKEGTWARYGRLLN